MVCCVADKEAIRHAGTHEDLTEADPAPAGAQERTRKIAQIQKELNEQLGWPRYARLQCLLDAERKLRKAVADENFAVGFKLGWMIAKELREVTGDGKT